MAKKTHLKVRMVPESNPDSKFVYYAKKPTKGEKAKDKLKLKKFIDYKLSNDDIINPKPHPEIYISCLHYFKLRPSECLILEDSHYGRTAALESGCNLMPIKKISDLNYNSVNGYVKFNSLDMKSKQKPWIDNKLNILITGNKGFIGQHLLNTLKYIGSKNSINNMLKKIADTGLNY